MKEVQLFGKTYEAETCPCCGGDADLHVYHRDNPWRISVRCTRCGLSTRAISAAIEGPHAGEAENAIQKALKEWNTRI